MVFDMEVVMLSPTKLVWGFHNIRGTFMRVHVIWVIVF